MTIKELDDRLSKVVDDFAAEMSGQYDNYSKEAASRADISELSRQTFYALNEFRKEIINYLKSQQ